MYANFRVACPCLRAGGESLLLRLRFETPILANPIRTRAGTASGPRCVITSTGMERIESVLSDHADAKPSQDPVASQWSADPEALDDDLLTHDASLMAESVALVESILVEALAARASDIHLENEHEYVRIRIRVDGDLHRLSRRDIDKEQLARMVRVLEVKAGIDIAEHRTAQGGQFEAVVGGQEWSVRVQSQPTVWGENIIMRLLGQSAELQSISELGFFPEAEERDRRLLANPGGLILVVGPTGSGQTTTLYAGLR
jgi:type IV pilus assembly protein PilB